MSILGDTYDNVIKKFEGWAPKASWDYKQYTNGWGTRARYPGEQVTPDEAQRRYDDEIAKAHSAVLSFAPNIDPGTKAALTDLTFNAGTKWQTSGLGQAVRDGDLDRVRQLYTQYVKAGGQTLPGLVDRRNTGAQWIGNGQAAATDGQNAMAAAYPWNMLQWPNSIDAQTGELNPGMIPGPLVRTDQERPDIFAGLPPQDAPQAGPPLPPPRGPHGPPGAGPSMAASFGGDVGETVGRAVGEAGSPNWLQQMTMNPLVMGGILTALDAAHGGSGVSGFQTGAGTAIGVQNALRQKQELEAKRDFQERQLAYLNDHRQRGYDVAEQKMQNWREVKDQQAQIARERSAAWEEIKKAQNDIRDREAKLKESSYRYDGSDPRGPIVEAGLPADVGMSDDGRIVRVRELNIGPRDENYPPSTNDVAAAPYRPSIATGLYGDAASRNVQDARSAASRRDMPGSGSMGTPDSKDAPYIRSGRAGISDSKTNAILDAHPDRERLAKYLETQRLWGGLRGKAPSGYDYNEDGSLNNLKEGTSEKAQKADKEIPTWLRHLEVSRTVLSNSNSLERGAAEAWNAIPGLRALNPMTSTLQARELAAHAVQQLVNSTRAANHANKVDERHLEWFVPKASDPDDLVQFKLSQAQNIFATYMSKRAQGAASSELSALIRKGIEDSENTSVFQRYKRITGTTGNAELDASMSKNVEDGPGMKQAPMRQSAPSGPAPGRYRFDPASGEMRPY